MDIDKRPINQIIENLAPIVWNERNKERALQKKVGCDRSDIIPWYFLNVAHPAIRVLYERYILKHQLFPPLGDLERVKFELYLLHPQALRELARYYMRTSKYE